MEVSVYPLTWIFSYKRLLNSVSCVDSNWKNFDDLKDLRKERSNRINDFLACSVLISKSINLN